MADFGAMVRRERLALGMSQADLAVKVGRSVSLIDKIENNRGGPSVKAKASVARVLGVSFDFKPEIDAKLARRQTRRGGRSIDAIRHLVHRAAKNKGVSEQKIMDLVGTLLRGDDPQAADQLLGAASQGERAKRAVQRKRKPRG